MDELREIEQRLGREFLESIDLMIQCNIDLCKEISLLLEELEKPVSNFFR